MKPHVRELLGDLTYTWPDWQIQIELTALHSTEAGAVRGMVEVTNGVGGAIYWNTFSLTGQTDRKALIGKLDKSQKRADGEWELDIDRMCQDAYKRHVAVPEPLRLADMPLDTLDVEFLYEPVLPEGLITLLLADQGSTKSYLMLYLAVCTALGIPSVFGPPKRQGPVIFFDWEVDEQTARRRLGLICRGLGAELPSDLYYVNMCERGRLLDAVRNMRYQIERHHACLAVIDSLTYATGADLNSAEYAAPTMSAIGSLGRGVTKLVSTHPNKSSRNAKTEDISVFGSGLFEFRARAIWHMRREEPRGSRFGVSLTPRKPFDGPPQAPLAYRMLFDNDAHSACFERTRVRDMPQLEEASMSLASRIRRALAKHGKLDTNDLSAFCGAKADVVRVECNRMPDVAPFIGAERNGKATVWMLLAARYDNGQDEDESEAP